MMRIKNYKPGKAFTVTACLLACLTTMCSKAQVIAGLQNNFTTYQTNTLHEKLYVHTNKNVYLTGEILWFKLYNTDASTNKMLDVSKVGYVELLDANHVPVMQAKIALNNGMGNGSFYLPFSVTNGNYELRAYTNWMKNFDAAYFYHQHIVIVNPVKSPPIQTTKPATSYDVQFFPEGGHLVQGMVSKVAFKVTAPDGMGAVCSGAIVNQQNDTVARFKTLKFGIGSFNFTPLAQTGYKAIIKAGYQVVVKDLPEISTSGYSLQTTVTNDGWDVAVQSADNSASVALYLVTHNRNTIEAAQSGSLANGSTHFTINKATLADGISFVTLFDDHQRPLCERLIFKQPSKKLLINAGTDAQSYDARKKVSLTIGTQNQESKSLPANLSVSVYRADSLQNGDAGNNIAGYLWLSADIKGRIEQPGYYLDNNSPEASEALDNLLLSQGWTQFDWAKILNGDKPRFTFLPEYTGPIVTGSITNTLTNQPAKNINTYLTVAGAHHQLYVTQSDSAGKLLFNTANFYGQHELIIQPNWTRDSTYRMDIASPFSDQFDTKPLPQLALNAAIKNTLISSSMNMQVQNIFDAKQLKEFANPLIDSIPFYGKPTYAYKLDDYTRFPTVEDVIHEYVQIVGITRNHGKMGFELGNRSQFEMENKAGLQLSNKIDKKLSGDPLVILDAKPIFDVDKAYAIDPLKVKQLDVVTTNYIYGPANFNGILSFTSYNGLTTNIELDPRSLVLDYEGLQQERKFYSPVYDTDQQLNSTIPDFRNVLYWNGNAASNQQGTSTLTFYTGDKPGQYIGIIQGLAPTGEAGSKSFTFQVISH